MRITSPEELARRYAMLPHEENGLYAECASPYDAPGRAPSHACYFCTRPGERTRFHRIDCDEYWCFAAGDPLEVWVIDAEGVLARRRFGIAPDAEPMLFFPKGVTFASRPLVPDGEGTFFTCITVPAFDPGGFVLCTPEEVLRLCPEAAGFEETEI